MVIGQASFWNWEFSVEGGRNGLILLPKGREGRGWSRVAGELSKVLGFFEAMTVLSSGVPSPAGKNYGMKVGLGVDMGETSGLGWIWVRRRMWRCCEGRLDFQRQRSCRRCILVNRGVKTSF